jgi:hypothetical protein
MDEFRARRVVDSLRDRGVNAHLFDGFRYRLPSPGQRIAQGDRRKENETMTPQQKALIAELRAADYPATWKLSASAADDKLVATGTQIQTSARA